MVLPRQALWAIEQLNRAGFACHAVGGCVRDALMKRTPNDYDLSSSATADELQRVFASNRVIETGLAHGTVTVLNDGMPLEITAYRGRDLTDDLRRRDFTVNAVAYHPQEGFFDPFGGQKDVENKVIRCTGDTQRLLEDPLRILRAVRFQSALGFEIAPETRKAMHEHRQRLCGVSAERLAQELGKLLLGDHVRTALMEHIEIIGAFIPEALLMRGFDQRNPNHCYDVLEHTAAVVAHTPADPVMRLAAFFHDMGKPESFHADENGVGHFYGHPAVSARIADETLKRLKLDNQTRERVVTLVAYHDRPIEATRPAVRRVLSRLGTEVFSQLMLLRRADNMGQAPAFRFRQEQISQLERIRDEILSENDCFSLKNLALNGRDLLALGVPAGAAIGQTLQALLSDVMDGKVENTTEALTDRVKAQKSSGGVGEPQSSDLSSEPSGMRGGFGSLA